MATRNIGGLLTAPTAPMAATVDRRHLNTIFVSGADVDAVYKMRGWDSTGMVFYHWTTADPSSSPPGGFPALIDIAIAATLIESN